MNQCEECANQNHSRCDQITWNAGAVDVLEFVDVGCECECPEDQLSTFGVAGDSFVPEKNDWWVQGFRQFGIDGPQKDDPRKTCGHNKHKVAGLSLQDCDGKESWETFGRRMHGLARRRSDTIVRLTRELNAVDIVLKRMVKGMKIGTR